LSISDVSAAETWIKEACQVLGLQTDIKVVMVVNRWRWTLDYDQDKTKPDFAMNMIKLERALQTALKRPIDLRLEAMSDKNRRKQRNVLHEPSSRSPA
jgi:hypothetical protein